MARINLNDLADSVTNDETGSDPKYRVGKGQAKEIIRLTLEYLGNRDDADILSTVHAAVARKLRRIRREYGQE
jgi:hypothetical protein